MAIKGSATITLTQYRDTQSVTRYYKLQPAGSSAPLKPETKPPSSDWTDSEPACDISKELYFCDLTIFSNGEWEYSTVSKSTSYEAAKEAYNKAQGAKDSIDNLEIGGRNLFIETDYENIKTQGSASACGWFHASDLAQAIVDDNSEKAAKIVGNSWDVAQYVNVVAGETYTMSCFARLETERSGAKLLFHTDKLKVARFNFDKDLTTDYQKFTYTWTCEVGGIERIHLRTANANDVLYVKKIKFEKGNRATDWTSAPEDVDAGIANAAKVATNFIQYDSTNGLRIGNKTSGSWSGYRSQILPDSFNILDESSNVLASYGDAKIELGKNAVSSIIEMCGGMARVSARYGGLTTIYSHNGGYQTTLDYDFNETTFKSKVGSNYGFYEFSYSGGVWECSYSGNNAGYVQVNLSDYGITLKTTSVNEYAGITINYWNGSETKFINADTTKPSRKLIFEIAESGTADNPDYANIEIERSKEGDVEHSKINLVTVHDGANVAGVHLDNGNIELDVSGEVRINNIPLDYIVEQGTSGDWKYRKWNSGIAECFGYISLGSISVSAVGNLYRGNTSVSLPSDFFNDTPSNVHITNGDPLVHIISINGRATNANTVLAYVWKATRSAVDSVHASFHVIGTWK